MGFYAVFVIAEIGKFYLCPFYSKSTRSTTKLRTQNIYTQHLNTPKFSEKLNPFRITQLVSYPVFDAVLTDLYYTKKLLPIGAINITYGDTLLSDTIGPHLAIMAFMQKKLDVIVGYANVYALAPIARFTPLWHLGVPLLTSVGW